MYSLPIVPSLFPNPYQIFTQCICNWIKAFQLIQLLHNPLRLGLFVNMQIKRGNNLIHIWTAENNTGKVQTHGFLCAQESPFLAQRSMSSTEIYGTDKSRPII